jgi:transcriptional regulator with XRE-family HTH domain
VNHILGQDQGVALDRTLDKDALRRLSVAVRELRGKLSQRQFAEELQVAQSTVQGWETAKNTPNLDNLEKLAVRRGQLPEEFVAYLYGRSVGSSLPIDQQIMAMNCRGLARIQRAIADKLAAEDE